MKKQVIQFRNGIFLAPSRTYGESYMEPIIRKYFGWNKPPTNEYDADAENSERVEIKSVKVLKQYKNKKSSLVEQIILQSEKSVLNRLIPFNECMNSDYDCNVQNVKRDHFDKLLYVMLFEDCLKIFITNTSEINGDNLPNWSDKHGRYDELGKSGQFFIKKNNIDWHIKNNLQVTLTWDEVYEIAKKV